MNENQDSYKVDEVEPQAKSINESPINRNGADVEDVGEEGGEEISPSFMDLGAPKHNRDIHLDNLLTVGHPTGHYHVDRDLTVNPVKRAFRIVIEPHTRTQYILWAVFAIIIGLSLISFLTESTLLVSSKIRHISYLGGVASASNSDYMNSGMSGNATGSSSTSQTGDGSANASSSDEVVMPTDPNKEYSFLPKSKIPKTSALEYLIVDVKTGEVILQKNPDVIYPLASMSKLMTALVATENLDLKGTATVSKDSFNTFGAEGRLVLGEKIKVSDLMYPLLMESSNDGAEVIADDYGRVDFMLLMNKKAAVLGMNNTYYNDPSGLDPKNTSTASDQFKLIKYVYGNHPEILDTTLVKLYKVGSHTWTNRNGFLNFPTFIGGKNGYIDAAKQTTVSLFDVPMYKGGNRVVAIVILQSVDRYADGLKLVEFLKNSVIYKPKDLMVQ